MIGNFKTTDRRNSDNLRSYLLRMKKKLLMIVLFFFDLKNFRNVFQFLASRFESIKIYNRFT